MFDVGCSYGRVDSCSYRAVCGEPCRACDVTPLLERMLGTVVFVDTEWTVSRSHIDVGTESYEVLLSMQHSLY